MALRIGQRSTLRTQPYKGVRDLTDPYAVPPAYATRARNMYLAQLNNGVGFAARPGVQLRNAENPLADVATGRIGQAIQTATIEDGSELNFCVCGGRLFRVAADFLARTDVTPVGITIDPAARVYLTPYSNRMVVNDGVNTPWVASDLASSPVTGAVIQYSTPGVPWRAYGPAVIYDGAVFFLVRFRDTEGRVARIAWSEPDDPFTGYFQPDFDNEWDVVENNETTIYALHGNNSSLDYYRGDSIGYLSGVVGSDFRTTATRDAIDAAIGTRAPATLVAYGNYTYFADAQGRPQRIQQGGGVQSLWPQLARAVKVAETGWIDVTARTACAALVPELDLVLYALWSPDPTRAVPQFPTVLFAFHAASGVYMGEWTLGPGIAVHAIGTMVDADGQKILCVLGTNVAATVPQVLGAGGYLWTLSALRDGLWLDNGAIPERFVTSAPLGYDSSLNLTVDQATAIVEEIDTDPTLAGIDIVVD